MLLRIQGVATPISVTRTVTPYTGGCRCGMRVAYHISPCSTIESRSRQIFTTVAGSLAV